ncbi:MAG: hypothetical protein ACI865_001560 [Flavobacteriaceae bacterium]|jgi:hypothetical protein
MKITHLITVLLSSFIYCAAFAQTPNRPVPYGILPYEYVKYDSNLDFYWGINTKFLGSSVTDPGYLHTRGVLLDADGYIVWFKNDFQTGVNGFNSFRYNEANGVFQEVVSFSSVNKKFMTMDTNFEFIDSVSSVIIDPDSHEFLIADDGARFISTRDDRVFDLTGYTINGGPGDAVTTCRCGGVQEFDLSGTLIFEWSSCDEIHPSEAYGFGYNVNNFDYFHINSIDVDTDDNLLISGRHTNSIIKVNHATGAVMWRLGGSLSDFTFIGDTGFSGQHDARAISPGVLTLHDNGNLASPAKTRGVTYSLDTLAWTATLIDVVDPTPSIYGGAMGNFTKIDNYDVINYGAVFRPSPNVVAYDASHTVAAEFIFQDSAITYRATPFHLDFTVPQPIITCLDSSGITYLKAPDGYASYEWSDGSTTQAIIPLIGQAYQVYVPLGVGKVASIPFGFDGSCDSNIGIDELNNAEISLVRTVDLLGRIVTERVPGSVYIELYSDGSSRLVGSIK